METKILRPEKGSGITELVRQAAAELRAGGIVVMPTETVYGIGARADLPQAVDALRAAKGRGVEKAFTVHVDSRQSALPFMAAPSGLAQRLMRKAWPGPLTLIVPAAEGAEDRGTSAWSRTVRDVMFLDGWVGLRCPDDPIAGELLLAAGGPVIASSANLAGNPAPRTGEEAIREMNGKANLLIDAGQTRYSKPSTIVKLTGHGYEILREGVYDAGSIARLAALKLLFVCTGNTCRSPMAAGLAAKMLAERLQCAIHELPARGIFVQSAGTAGGMGRAAAPAIHVMANRGIDISQHSSTALTSELVHQADFVFTMTRNHWDAAVRLAKSAEARISELIPGEDLADPVGGSEAEYEACARTIEKGLTVRMEEVLQ